MLGVGAHLQPPLKFLHVESTLIHAKLEQLRQVPTDQLVASLASDEPHSLKVRADGTVLDGHHRICVLKERGVAVDELPRQVLEREP